MRGNQRNASVRKPASATTFKRNALATACAIAVGGFAAQDAAAQAFVYQLNAPNLSPIMNGGTYSDKRVVNNQISNSPQINATDNDPLNPIPNQIGVFVPSGSPTVVNNQFRVLSSGNIASPTSLIEDFMDLLVVPTTIDPSLMNPVSGSAGILSSQIRTNATLGLPVENRASFSSTTLGVVNTGQPDAPIIVNNNSLTAAVQLNSADLRIDGQAPTMTTDSAVLGSITASTSDTAQGANTTTGTLNISASQTAFNAGGRSNSQASVTGTAVTVNLTDAADPTSGVTLTNNALVSEYGTNAANHQITLREGGATSFTGSAVISSAQNNVEDTGAVATPTSLINAQSGIIADLSGQSGAPTSTALGSSLTVNNNSTSSSSTGNTAGARTATGVTAGNAITFEQGIDVTGTGAATLNSVAIVGAELVTTNTIGSPITADLAIFSQQRNSGTYLDSMNRGAVTTTADSIDAATGSITSNRNSVTSTTAGNLAGNQVLVQGSTSHNATSAVGNVQVNNLNSGGGNTDLSATVNTIPSTGAVTVNVGFAASAVEGSITANNNQVGAVSEGSVATNAIRITATDLNASASTTPARSIANEGALTSEVRAGNSVSNVQINDGAGSITALVRQGGIRITAADQDGGTGLLGLDAASITSNRNAITATANGAVASNIVALTGTSGTADAGVANVQTNSVTSVTARVLDSGVTVNAGGTLGVADSTITLNRSTLASSAVGTDAVNAIGLSEFSNLTLSTNPAATTAATTAAGTAIATSSLSIASSQSNDADITSRTVNTLTGDGSSLAGVNLVGTDIDNTTVTVQANAVSATSIANRVTNAFEMPTTASFTAGPATNIASIANAQDSSGSTLALVSNSSPTAVGIAYSPDATGMVDSMLTVVNNAVGATNLGNQATNQISATGTNLVPTTATATGVSGTGSASGEFAVANQQTDSGTNRIARITSTNVGVNHDGSTVTGTVETSTLTVNNNTLAADSRNNSASNGVSLTGFSDLDTTLGLSNMQTGTRSSRAELTESSAGISLVGTDAGVLDSSNVTVTRNTLSALGLGSTASNTLEARSSNTLSGNATIGIVASVAGGVTPTVTADYALANQQSESGSIRATISATTRLQGADTTGADGVDITDTLATGAAVSVTNNTITGMARSTDAVNVLALEGTSSATGITAAIGSGQTSSGSVLVDVGGTTASPNMVGIDALSVVGVPLTVTGNTVSGSGVRNFASNAMEVTGGTVTSRATGTGFTVANTQAATASPVTTNVDPGTVGVVTDLIDGSSVTVNRNIVTSGANQNTSGNALVIDAQGTVTATAIASNLQTANTGNVTANAGVNQLTSIGATGLTGGVYTDATIGVANNQVSVSASRNVAATSLDVTGNSIAGASNGVAAMYTASNDQTSADVVSALSVVNSVGATGDSAARGSVTVTNNLLSATVAGNSTAATTAGGGTTVSLTADQDVAGSALATSTQNSTGGSMGATLVGTGGIGLHVTGAIDDGTATVNRNTVQGEAIRNNATTSVSATAGTDVTGATLANLTATPASISAVNLQNSTAGPANTDSTIAIGDVGMSAASFTGTTVSTVSRTGIFSEAGSNRASTTATIDATNAVTGSGIARSTQTVTGGGDVSANLNSSNIGVNATTATGADIVTSTATNNVQLARAIRSESTTGIVVGGGTITGDIGAGLALTTPASFSADNSQTSDGAGTVAAFLSQAGVTGLSSLGDLAGASTVQASSNVDAAVARANSASTSATLTATGEIQGSALARNVQTGNGSGLVNADASPDLTGVRVIGDVITSLDATVTGNSIMADATRNVALTTIAVEGLPITGAGNAALTTNGVPASFTASNSQTESATSTGNLANVGSATGFGVTVTGSLAGAQAITTTNNALVANAGANSAGTSADLTSTGAITGTAMATSTQTAQSVGATGSTATVSSLQFGLRADSAGAVPLTANRNVQSAQAVSNSASTSLALDAASVAGDTTFATLNTAGASFVATNTQTDASAAGATATNTAGFIGARVTGAAAGTSVTANRNTIEGIARSNSAVTSASIDATGAVTGSAAALNGQTASSTGGVNVTTSTNHIGLSAGTSSAGSVTASNNAVTSEGMRNVATNSLAVTGNTVDGTAAMAGGANSFTAGNTQAETAGGNSAVGNTIGTIGVTVIAGDLTDGTVVTSSNDVTSRARANSATTTLDLSASSSLTGSALSSNSQSTTPASTLGATVGVTTIGASAANNAVTGTSTVTAGGNLVLSEARRNVSTNTLTVDSGDVAGESVLVASVPPAVNRPASFTASNVQTATNGAATTSTATIGTLGLLAGQDVTGATVTVGNNTVGAITGGNQSTQSATIGADSQLTGSALVTSNQQSGDGAHTSGVTATTIGLSVGLAATSTPVTVSANTVTSESLRNDARNTLTVNASAVTGEGAAALDTAGTVASFSTVNVQNGNAASTANNTVTTLGVIADNVAAGAGNNYTVGNNTVSARAGVNTAANATNLGGVSSFSGTAATNNDQDAGANAAVTSLLNTTTVGSAITGLNGGSDGALTVNRNVLGSTAVQNVATNTLTGAAATMSATGLAAAAPSAYSVTNTQDALATGGATATNNYVTIGGTAGAVGASGNAFTVTSNSVFSAAGSNAAENRVTLVPSAGIDNTSTSSIDSTQNSTDGTILSQINSAAGGGVVGLNVTGAITASPIAVANNVLSADATRNAVINALNADASSIAGGAAPGGTTSFAIRNTQQGNDVGNVTAINFGGLIGASMNVAAASSAFGVVDNTVIASARVNAADNRLMLNSGSTLSGSATQGTGSVTNQQTAGIGVVSATAGGFAAGTPLNIGVVPSGLAPAFAAGSPITVTGNQVAAQGGANVATNVVNAGATSAIGGTAGAFTYAALNTQTSSATVTMGVQFTNIGVNSTTGGALGGNAVNVSNNQVLAIGYGNSANNQVAISGLAGGVSASAQVNNQQTSTGNITSYANGVNVGVTGTGLTNGVTGSGIVSNNAITVRAIGNLATNGIVAK